MRLFFCLAAALMVTVSAYASERVTYRYDALGRIVRAETRATGGGAGNGRYVEYDYDKAANRSRLRSSGRFKGNNIGVDQPLRAGEALLSADGRFLFMLQFDGHLVLYDQAGTAIWYTGTNSPGDHRGDFLVLQGDGNLVLYRADLTPVWNSGTVGAAAIRLDVQSDGNVVLYRADGNAPWSTATCCR